MEIIRFIQSGFQTALRSKSIIGLIFAYGLVWTLISIPFAGTPQAEEDVPSLASALLTVVLIFTSIYMQCGLFNYVRASLQGRATFADFAQGATRYYWRVFRLMVIVTLIGIIVLTLISLSVLTGEESSLNVLSLALAIGLLVVGLVGLFFVFLAPFAIVADEAKTIPAIKQSAAVIKRNFLQYAALILILVLMYFGVWSILTWLLVIAGILTVVPQSMPVLIGLDALSSLLNAFWAVVMCGTFMSFYLSTHPRETTFPSTSS